VLGPGDILYNCGDIDNRLYYIISGEIQFFVDKLEKDS
jgi:CRP-like cAMP-binding protein